MQAEAMDRRVAGATSRFVYSERRVRGVKGAGQAVRPEMPLALSLAFGSAPSASRVIAVAVDLVWSAQTISGTSSESRALTLAAPSETSSLITSSASCATAAQKGVPICEQSNVLAATHQMTACGKREHALTEERASSCARTSSDFRLKSAPAATSALLISTQFPAAAQRAAVAPSCEEAAASQYPLRTDDVDVQKRHLWLSSYIKRRSGGGWCFSLPAPLPECWGLHLQREGP